jgi:RNA polymerase-interacting CarD/CdnL/TRCF family regulator
MTMKLEDPQSNRMEKDYEESDVAHILRKYKFGNLQEMIQWLEREGDNDRRLAPGEVSRMIQDLQKVQQRKAEFSTDPHRLYEEMRR